jgi:hypothetical protein
VRGGGAMVQMRGGGSGALCLQTQGGRGGLD